MNRVLAAAALGLTWLVLVAAGGLMAGHGQAWLPVVVLIFMAGPLLGGFLLVQATEELDGFGSAVFWLGWCVAGVVGLIVMVGGGLAYEPSFGRSEAVIVMDTRCVPDDNGCASQVRVSTAAQERDLGWLTDCDPMHAPGQEAVVLVDPRGWFQPEVSTCSGNGRGLGVFVVASAGYVAALTLVQVMWLAGIAGREARRHRRYTSLADPTRAGTISG
jgi:hypothetical protein